MVVHQMFGVSISQDTGCNGLVVQHQTAVREYPGSSLNADGCVYQTDAAALGMGCTSLMQCLCRLSLPSSMECKISISFQAE